MSNKNPQNTEFVRSKIFNNIHEILEISIFLLSILQIYLKIFDNKTFFVISGTILILEFCFNYIREISFEKAHKIREMALLDNSFNEKRIPNYNSSDYFSNELINKGEIKLLANIHENVLFTMNITSKMLVVYRYIVSICSLIIILSIFYNGINDYTSILLSFILTGGYLRKLLEIRSLNISTEILFNKINSICSDFDNSIHEEQLMLSKIIEILLQYENEIYSTKIVLSERIFKKLNQTLSEEWEDIKSNYSIYKSI